MASKIAQIDELLLQILQYVHSRPLLYNLCLVNRRFHHIFAPALWRHVELHKGNFQCSTNSDRFEAIAASPWVSHVEELTLAEDLDLWQPDEEMPYTFNLKLQALLGKLTNLRRFTFEEAIITHDSLIALSNIASLQHLDLKFHYAMGHNLGIWSGEHDDDHELFGRLGPSFGHPQQYLSRFQNLTSLTLREMWWHIVPWRDCIVEMLLNSPKLEHLNLSLSDDAIERAECEDRSTYTNFFHDVCHAYSARCQDRLRLKSLELYRLNATPELGEEVPTALDLSTLEVMDISMRPFAAPWAYIERAQTPRLKALSLYEVGYSLWRDAGDALNEQDDRRMLIKVESSDMHGRSGVFPLFADHPMPCISGIQFPIDSARYMDHDFVRLKGMVSLAYLDIPFDLEDCLEKPGAQADSDWALLLEVVASLPALQALRLTWDYKDSHRSLDAKRHSDLEELLAQVVARCSSLRYVKAGRMAWSALPKSVAAGESRLVALDRWEDAVEGPAWVPAFYISESQSYSEAYS